MLQCEATNIRNAGIGQRDKQSKDNDGSHWNDSKPELKTAPSPDWSLHQNNRCTAQAVYIFASGTKRVSAILGASVPLPARFCGVITEYQQKMVR